MESIYFTLPLLCRTLPSDQFRYLFHGILDLFKTTLPNNKFKCKWGRRSLSAKVKQLDVTLHMYSEKNEWYDLWINIGTLSQSKSIFGLHPTPNWEILLYFQEDEETLRVGSWRYRLLDTLTNFRAMCPQFWEGQKLFPEKLNF